MKTIEEQVIDELVERLREITITNGYRTNLGLSVYQDDARVDLQSAQDPTAIFSARSSVVSEIVAMGDGGTRRAELDVVIELYSTLDAMGAIADIKKAYGKEFEFAQDVMLVSWSQAPNEAVRLRAYSVEWTAEFDERVEDPYVGV